MNTEMKKGVELCDFLIKVEELKKVKLENKEKEVELKKIKSDELTSKVSELRECLASVTIDEEKSLPFNGVALKSTLFHETRIEIERKILELINEF